MFPWVCTSRGEGRAGFQRCLESLGLIREDGGHTTFGWQSSCLAADSARPFVQVVLEEALSALSGPFAAHTGSGATEHRWIQEGQAIGDCGDGL